MFASYTPVTFYSEPVSWTCSEQPWQKGRGWKILKNEKNFFEGFFFRITLFISVSRCNLAVENLESQPGEDRIGPCGWVLWVNQKPPAHNVFQATARLNPAQVCLCERTFVVWLPHVLTWIPPVLSAKLIQKQEPFDVDRFPKHTTVQRHVCFCHPVRYNWCR